MEKEVKNDGESEKEEVLREKPWAKCVVLSPSLKGHAAREEDGHT